MLELAGEQGERIDLEQLAELVLAQAEQLHQPHGSGALHPGAELRIVAVAHRDDCRA